MTAARFSHEELLDRLHESLNRLESLQALELQRLQTLIDQTKTAGTDAQRSHQGRSPDFAVRPRRAA